MAAAARHDDERLERLGERARGDGQEQERERRRARAEGSPPHQCEAGRADCSGSRTSAAIRPFVPSP